jgi:hypothetical protein
LRHNSSVGRDGRDEHDQARPMVLRQMEYTGGMMREQVKEILDRVLTWPPEQQHDASHICTRWSSRTETG